MEALLLVRSIYILSYFFTYQNFKIIISYSEIRCIALRVLQTSKGHWVFCSANHFSEGGVNTNLNNVLSQLG